MKGLKNPWHKGTEANNAAFCCSEKEQQNQCQ